MRNEVELQDTQDDSEDNGNSTTKADQQSTDVREQKGNCEADVKNGSSEKGKEKQMTGQEIN